MVSIFTATAKAAMTAVPKLFTRPWTMRMPKFITDCCTQVRRENRAISSTRSFSQRTSWRLGRSWGILASVNASSPSPDTHWERLVAKAAPATPQGTTTTNTKSSTMFSTALTPKNNRGVAELPMARSRQAK